MKKLVSFVLSLVVLSNFIILVSAEKESGTAKGKVIEFGSYPQTMVTDQALAKTLESLEPDAAGEFEDYYDYPTVSGYHSEYLNFNEASIMNYRDVTHNNERYRGVKITNYRPELTDRVQYNTENQRLNGFEKRKWYWFKYEPLKWIVFDEEQGLALCSKVIDSQPFNNEYREEEDGFTVYWNGRIMYANNFSTSYLCRFLKEDFYNTAFSADEQASLTDFDTITETIDGESGEMRIAALGGYVSLMTYKQIAREESKGSFAEVRDEFQYSDTEISTICTDYAKVQGLDISEGVKWWLATPEDTTIHNYVVYPSGVYKGPDPVYEDGIQPAYLNGGMFAVNTGVGVRPVICLEKVIDKQEEEEKENNKLGWFSKDEAEDTTPVIAEGECNSDIDWSLSEDGVLTISGKGDMPEWDDSEGSMPPWYYENPDAIKSVVIEGKITTIGKLAFYGCKNLESVTIPASVKYIDECVFNECDALKEINYGSTAEDWANVKIDEDNIDLSQLTINYSEKAGLGGDVIVLAGCGAGGAAISTGVVAVALIVLKKKKIF